jgi:hypothetical protein
MRRVISALEEEPAQDWRLTQLAAITARNPNFLATYATKSKEPEVSLSTGSS